MLSQVDFETVQVAPLGGGTTFTPVLGGSIGAAGTATTTGGGTTTQ